MLTSIFFFFINDFCVNELYKWRLFWFFFGKADIPLKVVLSHVDELDLCVFGDLTKTFVSRHVKNKVELAKMKFRVQDSQVLPIASYVQGVTQNIAQDILALQAVESILNEALSYINNQ